MLRSDIYAEELKRIYNKKHILIPKDVLDEARHEENPLHNYFEWDDGVAAEEYRLNQARHLITSVKIESKTMPQTYINVVTEVDSTPTQGYVHIDRIVSEPNLHKQALDNALKEIAYWMEKYQSIKELNNLINQDVYQEAQHLLASM